MRCGFLRNAGFAAAAGAAPLAGWPALARAAAEGELHVAWWRVALGFLVSAGLALGVIYLLWVRQQGRTWPQLRLGGAWSLLRAPARRMRLVETLKLNPQVDLCLIHYEDTELAVAAGPKGGSLVFMRPKPANAAEPPPSDESAPC